MEPITLEQAKTLTPGTTLYHRTVMNADKTPQRWRVSGQVTTWKTDPFRISVPLKRGLYCNIHLTEKNLFYFSLKNGKE
jgi:hypothetical protein